MLAEKSSETLEPPCAGAVGFLGQGNNDGVEKPDLTIFD